MLSRQTQNLRHQSKLFALIFKIILFGLPLSSAVFWSFFNHLPDGFHDQLPVKVATILPTSTLIWAFIVSSMPLAVMMYATASLVRLFSLYEAGVFFATENINCYRKLGISLIALFFAKILFNGLLSIVLSFANPPGQRMLVFGFGSSDLMILCTGAIVILVSSVMEEAARLEQEQALTV